MKPDPFTNDPAFPVMAMDILSNVLSRADNPGELGTYLTEEIRDLTGARCVLLIQCLGTAAMPTHRVFSVNPMRRREWAETLLANRLYEVVHRMPAARFWRGDEPLEVAGLLSREGFELSMAFPLDVGAFRVGAMLVLGLPDEEHISSVLSLLNDLSTIVALVLRNSFLFERQEEIIQERTAELSASEEKYRTLFESANDGVFIHEIMENGLPGPFIEVNEVACRRLGYSRAELSRMSPMELDDPQYYDTIALAMKRLLTEGHAVFETAQMAKDGQSIPVEVSTRVLELSGKRLLFSIVRDITERKRAEEAIHQSEEKFRVLAETSPTAIVLHQGEKFIYANPATTSISGYSEAELLNMNFWDFFSADSRDVIRRRGLARLRGESVPLQYEQKLTTKSGEEKWVVVSAGNIKYSGKSAIIATLLDITEAKRAEERLSAALAEKVVLLQEVHHRVKNNLQIICSLLDLQSESIAEKRSRSCFRECQDRIRSMALIHAKLYESEDLASIDFGEYIKELSMKLFDSYMVDSGRISLKVVAEGVSMGIDRAIPWGLIVNELVSNALKHAFPDNRSGEISIRIYLDEDDWITLIVADSGIGMPPGLDFKNTGTLGLQLVNMLTLQLKGQISMEGTKGTAFKIRSRKNSQL
jgi:PAS domain S-box-containing protein